MRPSNERGIALGLVIITAMVFSIAAFAALTMSMARINQSAYHVRRLQARYAAEAGLVWAMQQLWQNPTWSDPAGDADVVFDVNGNGTTTDPNDFVDVEIPPCTATPCQGRKLQVHVTYTLN